MEGGREGGREGKEWKGYKGNNIDLYFLKKGMQVSMKLLSPSVFPASQSTTTVCCAYSLTTK